MRRLPSPSAVARCGGHSTRWSRCCRRGPPSPLWRALVVRLEQPGWWKGQTPGDWLKAALLTPAGILYGTAAKARFALAKPYSSSLPVICVGNFTVGGAGKTPLALMVARLVRNLGRKPAFLTRGY